MITVRADIKKFFFDRERVLKAVSRARRRALSRAGAFVRTRARTSIRKRRGTSKPGRPPYSHEGSLRKGILFGYDPQRESVVVGPVGFKGSTAPTALEFGGPSTRYSPRTRRDEPVEIGPRPYMRPALEAEVEAGTIPKHWANSVRSS